MSRFAAAALCRRAAAAVFLLAAGAGAAQADPPLWRVDGSHVQIDLFGSIHLLSDATHWKTPALEADVAKADAIWFEIPLGAGVQADAAKLMQAKGLLPTGQTLSDLLPPTLFQRASALAVREGLSVEALQHLRPWLAELELTVTFYQRQGYREDLGVENQIDRIAPPAATRAGFETLAQQVDIFADEPPAEQVASLKETLDEIDTDPGLFARAADAWSRGDVKAIEREVVDPMRKDDASLYQRILVDRNRRFADRIEQIARTGAGHVFVVVGVGHLVGPQGVPALLRRDGFTVEGP